MFYTLCYSNKSVILAITAFRLINVNNMLLLNLDDISIKIQINNSNQLCITYRLKGSWCLLSFLACYKNNFGSKCLHSTNFILKEASLLSHPNKSTSTHAQIAFLTYFCNSKRLVIVLDFVSIKNYSAIIKTINYNALKIPTSTELNEKFPWHASI